MFREHQQAIYRRTDRMFGYLMVVQWLAAIAFALLVGPLTWAGAESQMHVHVWAAVVLGGVISVCPPALALVPAGRGRRRGTPSPSRRC